MRCPICRCDVEPRKSNRAFPFCSPRCRRVDLGRWLNGDYVLSRPIDPENDADALEAMIETVEEVQ